MMKLRFSVYWQCTMVRSSHNGNMLTAGRLAAPSAGGSGAC